MDAHIRLEQGARVSVNVLSDRDDSLKVVLFHLCVPHLVNRRPPDIANKSLCDSRKRFLHLLRLHPNFVDHVKIRLPRLVGPLYVRNPNVLTGVRKQRRVHHFQEDVCISLFAVRMHVRDARQTDVLSENCR